MSESNEINEKALKLHRDLLAGNLTATARIAILFSPNIANALKRKFSNIDDEHLIQTAADDAILYYLKTRVCQIIGHPKDIRLTTRFFII